MDLIVTALLLSVSCLFILSGGAKLISYKVSVEYISNIEWLPKILKKPVGYSFPIIEVICGVGLVLIGNNFFMNLFTIFIILLFLSANLQAVFNQKEKECYCFGVLFKTRTGLGGVIQNILMLAAILPNLLVLVQPLTVIQTLDIILLLVLGFGIAFTIYTLLTVRTLYELINEIHT